MNNASWFYIDSFIHISIKKTDVLLYNPYTGKIIQYHDNQAILKLLTRLKAAHNLWVTAISKEELSNPSIDDFVKKVKMNFMGDLLDCSFSDGKPVQMPSQVKIQKDVKYLKNIKSLTVGEKIMDYLSEISIYLNDNCTIGCDYCSRAYCQFLCCHSRSSFRSGCRNLGIHLVERLFEEIQGSTIENVNILGGNVFLYPKLGRLVDWFKCNPIAHTYFIHYLNIAGQENGSDRLKNLCTSFTRVMVPVSFPLEKKLFRRAFEILFSNRIECQFLFIISNISDFQKLEMLQLEYPDMKSIIRLYYNGKNQSLFEKCAYIDRQTIENRKPSLKDIYINESVNRFHFGKLTVLPDGTVYANVNFPGLGKLEKKAVSEMLFKEMNSRNSWRKIRRYIAPCKSCVFQNLCPPLSNYNIAIGRNNLCSIVT